MNDYDSILARMKADMPSDITVIEGSLAGDILTAVANELAKFYDMEIRDIYEKAFVTTATGDYLTRACMDYGVERREGEGDDELRARTLHLIRNQASSGNESHYLSWVKSFADVKAVHLEKGENGKVGIYVITDNGDEGLISHIADYIEENRPIGAEVTVERASQRVLNMSVDVSFLSGYNAEAVKPYIQSIVEEHYRQFERADAPAYISNSLIRNMIAGLEGIRDVISLTIDGTGKSFTLEYGQYPVMGTLSVS